MRVAAAVDYYNILVDFDLSPDNVHIIYYKYKYDNDF